MRAELKQGELGLRVRTGLGREIRMRRAGRVASPIREGRILLDHEMGGGKEAICGF